MQQSIGNNDNKNTILSRQKFSWNKLKKSHQHQLHLNYQFKQKLGIGSYAQVFKAIHKPTGQKVAVKIFNKQDMTQQQILKTHQQIDIHKKLFHTNIVRLYQFYQYENKMFLFMEYCEHGQLFDFIDKNGPVSKTFACKIFKQILCALKYLKSQRIFHRDVKCQNIVFDENWSAKLIDFGLATKQDQGCVSESFCGSPSYIAPQIHLQQTYKAQMIDIWCVGVTLYVMLTGQLPFDDNNAALTKKNIIQMKFQMKKKFSPEIREVFHQIFVEHQFRSTIQELQQTEFYKNSVSGVENFININTDQIYLDSEVMERIDRQMGMGRAKEMNSPNSASNQFSPIKIRQSVLKFKLDQKHSLYYLMCKKMIKQGYGVKSDILSLNFKKKKKRVSQSCNKQLMKFPSVQNIHAKQKISDINNVQSPHIKLRSAQSHHKLGPFYSSLNQNANALTNKSDKLIFKTPVTARRFSDLINSLSPNSKQKLPPLSKKKY